MNHIVIFDIIFLLKFHIFVTIKLDDIKSFRFKLKRWYLQNNWKNNWKNMDESTRVQIKVSNARRVWYNLIPLFSNFSYFVENILQDKPIWK